MSDQIAAEWSVNQTLLTFPETVAVFNRHGVDSCCGGDATLLHAAVEAGVPIDTLLEELRAVAITTHGAA